MMKNAKEKDRIECFRLEGQFTRLESLEADVIADTCVLCI